MGGGSRKWIFTVNDIDQSIVKTINLNFDRSMVRWAIWKLEKGKEGHVHMQGAMQVKDSVSKGKIIALFQGLYETTSTTKRNQPYVEKAKGTITEMREYVLKEDTKLDEPIEIGTAPKDGQGARSDLDEIGEAIKNGKRMNEIAAENPGMFIKFHRGFGALVQELQTEKLSKQLRKVNVEVYFGDTGSGKTYTALVDPATKMMKDSTIKKMVGNKWYDGYSGEKTIVYDEFTGWVTWAELLQITDIYPMQVEVKGSSCWAEWTTVIFTTNKWPALWYAKHLEKVPESRGWGAFCRRVTKWSHFTVGSGLNSQDENPVYDRMDFDNWEDFKKYCEPEESKNYGKTEVEHIS